MKLISGLVIDENMTASSKYNLKLIDGYISNFKLSDGKFIFKYPIVVFESYFTKTVTDELTTKRLIITNGLMGVAFTANSNQQTTYEVILPDQLPTTSSFLKIDNTGLITYSDASQYDMSFSFQYPTTETVGGLEAGTLLVNTTLREIIFRMLYKERSPSLVDPSVTMIKNVQTLQEVGAVVTITFTAMFDRGSINPANGTSGFRSGLPQRYTYSGPSLSVYTDTTELTNSQVLNDYVVTLGVQTWSVLVDYEGGEVPMTNFGNVAGTALPPGSVMATQTIIGVYPFFATSSSITNYDKLPLTDSNVVTFTLAAETTTQKQSFDVPTTFVVGTIQTFNPITLQWQNINIDSFTQTDIERDINENQVAYKRFTHNGPTIGSRQIRLIKQ